MPSCRSPGEALEEERTETGTGTTAERVEDKEALKTRASVGELANAVEGLVNQLLADGVVTTSVVVRGILLTRDEGLGVEERTEGAGADLVDDVGLQIDVDRAGHVLAAAGLAEESRETVIVLRGAALEDASIGAETVLGQVELPAGVTDLDTGLTDVEGKDLTHC